MTPNIKFSIIYQYLKIEFEYMFYVLKMIENMHGFLICHIFKKNDYGANFTIY
jgi:hypothetical protein